MPTVPPLALAMVICDAIWVDPATGKKTILGTFSTVVSDTFPVTLTRLGVYLALTDTRGMMNLKLRLVDVDEVLEPIQEHLIEFEMVNPTHIAEGVIHLVNVTFPDSGEYRLQLFASEELIIERRIIVMPRSEQEVI